jgi:hypothetical protein
MAFLGEIVSSMSEEELRYVLSLCEKQLRPHRLGLAHGKRRVVDDGFVDYKDEIEYLVDHAAG